MRNRVRGLAAGSALFTICVMFHSHAAGPAANRDPADLVLINGNVYTADEHDSVVEAFAVKGDRFVDSGTSKALQRDIGKNTKVLDLRGKFVTPGLTDGHFHNEGGGHGVDLSGARTLADVSAAIDDAVKKAQPGDLVLTNMDWHEAQLKEQRLPTAKELDVVSPNNPVVAARGGHSFILNSAALRKWNITKDTISPEGGQISKDAHGELTGELIDNAKRLVNLPPPPAVFVDDILTTQRKVNAYGITSVRIPGFYRGDMFQAYKLLKQLRDNGQLTLRFNVYLPGFGVSDPQKMHDILVDSGIQPNDGDEWVRVAGVKLGVDGGFEGGHMTKPYVGSYGRGGTFYGLTTVPAPQYTAVVKELNRMGWRVTTHAVGDAAIDQVIDAYEAANAEKSIIGQGWSIEHLFVSRPDQLDRLKKLDIALSVQDHLYLAAPSLKKYIGMERASEVTPIKTYLDRGFLVAGGTDSPVVPLNPFWELYHFNTRDTISDGVYGPDQRILSRPQLLRLITINYSKLTGEDKIKGSIEPGKLADFAVLSDDFLAIPSKQIPKMKTLATYVGGKEVFRDPGFNLPR